MPNAVQCVLTKFEKVTQGQTNSLNLLISRTPPVSLSLRFLIKPNVGSCSREVNRGSVGCYSYPPFGMLRIAVRKWFHSTGAASSDGVLAGFVVVIVWSPSSVLLLTEESPTERERHPLTSSGKPLSSVENRLTGLRDSRCGYALRGSSQGERTPLAVSYIPRNFHANEAYRRRESLIRRQSSLLM